MEYILRDATGPDGAYIGNFGKEDSVIVDYPFITGRSNNDSYATGEKMVEVLEKGLKQYVQNGETKTVYAGSEVIVSTGSIESPKLLMLSGIGHANDLKPFGLPIVADVPGVGENFHNHVLTGMIAKTTQPVPAPNQNMAESCLLSQRASAKLPTFSGRL